MLKGKRIILGISGGIAAYKIANVASALVKLNADVHVIMTENARNFITEKTFETLTKNRCIVDTFDRRDTKEVYHVSLAESADVILFAPATANIIAKVACGIADDMLSTTVLAANCPIIFAPSMNVNMYNNKIVQKNINTLKEFGYQIIEADEGYLACGVIGKGKLPDENILVENIIIAAQKNKDLEGKKVLVTAGATKEFLDPVRFITNNSSGKMGWEIARAAKIRGAKVTLIKGETTQGPLIDVAEIKTETAEEMYNKVIEIYEEYDIIIKAAAVGDYTPKNVQENKIKKIQDNLVIELDKTKDILKHIGTNKIAGQFICGFSMETENLIENSIKKLESKNLDMIVANNLFHKGAGFKTQTNKVTIITKEIQKDLPLMSKFDVANCIFDEILKIKN